MSCIIDVILAKINGIFVLFVKLLIIKFSYKIQNDDYSKMKFVLVNRTTCVYLILGIIALSCTGIFAQNIWLQQSSPTAKWLYRCSFTDSLHGWAAGEDGVIIRTTNGGSQWTILNSPVDFFVYDIFFLNNRLGWAIANDNFDNGTAVLSTTNGGDNW